MAQAQMKEKEARAGQKKRKEVVRKASAETQEYESCQQNDMDVDRIESKEETSFVTSGNRFGWMVRTHVHVWQAVQDGRLQVLGHRVDHGGRRRRAADGKPLRGFLHFKARREERASNKWQAMEDYSR